MKQGILLGFCLLFLANFSAQAQEVATPSLFVQKIALNVKGNPLACFKTGFDTWMEGKSRAGAKRFAVWHCSARYTYHVRSIDMMYLTLLSRAKKVEYDASCGSLFNSTTTLGVYLNGVTTIDVTANYSHKGVLTYSNCDLTWAPF